jgi:hypothetical protein
MSQITDSSDRQRLEENLAPLLAADEKIVFACYAERDYPVVVTTERLVLPQIATGEWTSRAAAETSMYWLSEVVGFEMPLASADLREHRRRTGQGIDREPSEITLLLAHAEKIHLTVEGSDTAVELQRAIAENRRS